MKTMSRDFRTLFGAGALGSCTDGQLLDVFLARRDEAAFEELVNRHGPMVWGVCRRILHRHHDAEDAFQATFLVLARRGDAIVPQERLANWLYGVAVQTALKARTLILKRGERERQVMTMPEPVSPRLSLGNELGPWLDEELRRLPEKYRAPIVLCDLEGESHKAAAGRLGWPIGTLSGRLSRARALLASRLNRHWPGLSAGTLTLALGEVAQSASLPPSLVDSTAKAAAQFVGGGVATELLSAHVVNLAESVLTALVWSKLKVVTVWVMSVGLIGLCLGGQGMTSDVLAGPTTHASEADPQGEETPKRTVKKAATPESDLELLQGTWFGSVTEVGGRRPLEDPTALPPQVKLIIKGNQLRWRGPRLDQPLSFGAVEDLEFTLKLAVEKNQPTIDLTLTPRTETPPPPTYLGIYSLGRGHVMMRLNHPGEKRPQDFESRSQERRFLLKLNLAILQDYESLLEPTQRPVDVEIRNRRQVQGESLESLRKQAVSRIQSLFGGR